MGWQTVLTNGKGLFGTADFFSALAFRQPALTRVFDHGPLRSIGPLFDRSSAIIDRICQGYDGSNDFYEMSVEFDAEASHIGVHSFIPHNNILSLLAGEMGAQIIKDLHARRVVVFHDGNWDSGFSSQSDIELNVNLSEVLVSGSMYVGFPVFFQRIAIKGGIIEGAEGVWEWAPTDFPFKRSEGRIHAIDDGQVDEVVLGVQSADVKGSFPLPRSLAPLLGKMFDVERSQDLLGQGVMLLHYADDDEAIAIRPITPHDHQGVSA